MTPTPVFLNALPNHQQALERAKSYTEFKRAAKNLLLAALETSGFVAYSAHFIRSCAHFGHQPKEVLDFAQKIVNCNLHLYRQAQAKKLIKRIFRNANPQFTLPDLAFVTPPIQPRRETIYRQKKRGGLHTNDPSQRAVAIATREAEMVWRLTGDYQAFVGTWRHVYETALKEIYHSADTLLAA